MKNDKYIAYEGTYIQDCIDFANKKEKQGYRILHTFQNSRDNYIVILERIIDG